MLGRAGTHQLAIAGRLMMGSRAGRNLATELKATVLKPLFKFTPRDRRFLIELMASDKQLPLPMQINLAVTC